MTSDVEDLTSKPPAKEECTATADGDNCHSHHSYLSMASYY